MRNKFSAAVQLLRSGGDWHHGKEKSVLKEFKHKIEAVEMQYYISDDKKHIVGYIKNRSYNVTTKGHVIIDTLSCYDITTPSHQDTCINYDFTCPNAKYGWGYSLNYLASIDHLENINWNDVDKPLKIDKGLNIWKKYNIDFYSFKEGDWFDNDKKLPSNGKLKIRYPLLRTKGSGKKNPVIWFVAHRKGSANGMAPKNDNEEKYEQTIKLRSLNNKNQSGIKVYPNPFGEYLIIESPKKDELELMDGQGRVVIQYSIEDGEDQISTQGLSKGVYYIHLKNQNFHTKLIKQ